MQLFSIAFNNVKKNLKNYFMYIFSMIFSVTIYFIFKSIEYNDEVNKALLSVSKLSSAFKAAAVVIVIFSAIFIWYSNSFFVRKRKKEIGLYSLLGIEKKQIGQMLFYETLSIGIIALGIGIVFGIILSKIFIGILVNLIGISTVIKFTISFKAINDTIIIFIILFVLISIHGYSIIYRYELIDLFKAESKREKEPRVSFIWAILSIILIGGGYYIYTHFLNDFMMTTMITLILVIAGTYALFNSFIVFIVKVSKKNEKKYFKGLNMISTSQLLYRIKGNAKTLATIAILSACTLTAMGVSVSFYKNFTDTINKSKPFSYVTNLPGNDFDKKFKRLLNNYKNNKLLSELHINVGEVKYKNGANKEQDITVISESELKKIFNVRKLKDDLPSLKSEKEIIMFDELYNPRFNEDYVKEKSVNLGSSQEKFNIIGVRDYSILNEHMLFKTIVVKDSVFKKYKLKDKSTKFDLYIINNQKKCEDLNKEVIKLYNEIKEKNSNNDNTEKSNMLSSFYSEYKEISTSAGVMIFIGIFLGLVFLTSTGSIIFFKQLSEAQEEITRYDILKKVGVDNKEIKISIYKQMSFVFFIPFAVGSIHSLVAVSLFTEAFKMNLLEISILTILPYLVIYVMYYIITSHFYYKIVTRER